MYYVSVPFLIGLLLLSFLVKGDASQRHQPMVYRSSSPQPPTTCQINESIDNLAQVIKEMCFCPPATPKTSSKKDRVDASQQAQIDSLHEEVRGLRLAVFEMKKKGGDGDSRLFFSLASTDRFGCFDCPVTYNVVHVNSHPSAMDPNSGRFKAPTQGHYLFQFHALVEAHTLAKVQLVINDRPILHMYDRDIDGGNNRYAMISQSVIYEMQPGDVMFVKLLEGALKGGGTHAFTSLIGLSIAAGAAENDDANRI